MKAWATVALSLMLAACASAPVPPRAGGLFNDRLFTPSTERISADDVFALSPEMRKYLADDIAGVVRLKGSQQGLVDALYDRGLLKLDYDSGITRNASQAFAARAGNCLSLVIMTAAFAREMGISVRYQNVFVDETWSRSGNFYLSIGHVNLTLGSKPAEYAYNTKVLTVDFLPADEVRGLRHWVISEPTIVAMFMNNRAAEALTSGNVNDAYWWAREAIVADPRFLSAYNTLGVVYQSHGDLAEAQRALEYVLGREPENANAMSNLVSVLKARGDVAASREMSLRLAHLEPNPPFGYFKRGIAAMHDRDYALAKEMFEKEIRRAAYYHEFHFWLALAYVGLGDVQDARAQIQAALEYSATRSDHDLYAAKLERLNASVPVIRR